MKSMNQTIRKPSQTPSQNPSRHQNVTLRRTLIAAAVLLLAACKSTPPVVDTGPFGAGASVGTGAQAQPMVATEQFKFQADLSERLQDALLKYPDAHMLPMPRSDGYTQFRIDGDSFKTNSGEMSPATLTALSEAVAVLKTSGACVVHVIGERHTTLPAGVRPDAQIVAGPPAGAVGADLGDRRSAAVAAELVRLGLPAARLRSESRVQPGSEGGVIIVVRPLVAGHEQDAWTPPPVEA